MRYLFLNQYIPPDPSPTAKLLGDVAEELEAQGHQVVWLGARADYRAGKAIFGSRALRELVDLVSLLIRGWFIHSRCDVIFFLSSPPLLAIVARLLCVRHHKAKLVHWVMDLYPEVAVALGELKAGSMVERLCSCLTRIAYKKCDTVIALDGDMVLRLNNYGIEPVVQRPWPPFLPLAKARSTHLKNCSEAIESFVWLYSGNLGKAHEWEILLEAQSVIEKSGHAIDLVFQGGGSERNAATKYAGELGLKRCFWHDYVSEDKLLGSLLDSDVLIASQKPETIGCLWPSKLALISMIDRPHVWIGPSDSTVTEMLRSNSMPCFSTSDSAGLAKQILKWCGNESAKRVREEELMEVRERVGQEREVGILKIAAILEGLDS